MRSFVNGGVTAGIELPSITNVSFFSRIDPNWDVMGDVQFTQLVDVQGTGVRPHRPGRCHAATPENFKDVVACLRRRELYLDHAWKFRGGLAWDQSPVNDTDRTPRLPDADRFWLSVGAQYTYAPQPGNSTSASPTSGAECPTSQNAGDTAAIWAYLGKLRQRA